MTFANKKLLLLLISSAFLAVAGRLTAGSVLLQNLAVTGTLSPGQAITITFQISDTANSGNSMQFAVGISDRPQYLAGSNDDPKATNWLADAAGVFGSANWWLNGVSQAATNMATTDVAGLSGADLNAGPATTAWKNVSIVTRIPQEMTGTMYLYIPAREVSMTGNCSFSAQFDSKLSQTLAITGAATYRFDLKFCNDGSDADGTGQITTRLRYKIYNYGESGVDIKNFKWRWYFNGDGVTSGNWQTQNGLQTAAYYPSGVAYCGTPNNTSGTFIPITLTDCGGGRTANMYYEWTPTTGPQGGQDFYLIPPGGGWAGPSNQEWFRPNSSVAISRANDYTRPSDYPSCGASPYTGGDSKYATLYYNGSLVCEYINATTPDPNTGNEPCNIAGSCGASPTPTTTPTPAMQLVKSMSVAGAALGDTVTYCLAWTNNAAAAQTFDVWDTISTYISYLGCISGCAKAGNVVSWTIVGAAPGASGSVCFWGTVNGYPWHLEPLEDALALRPRGADEALYFAFALR